MSFGAAVPAPATSMRESFRARRSDDSDAQKCSPGAMTQAAFRAIEALPFNVSLR